MNSLRRVVWVSFVVAVFILLQLHGPLAAAQTGWTVAGSITPSSLSAGSRVSLMNRRATIATTWVDNNGNFAFSGIANGKYKVTPNKSGITFSPTSIRLGVNGANVYGINFRASGGTTQQASSISGAISGGAGATISLSGTASASVTADSSGNYQFTGLANGTYTVTPKKTGYTISPTTQNVSLSGANVAGVNFSATAQTWSITGTISPTAGGAGAAVTLSGGSSATTTTDANGNYSFSGLANGTYTITPSLTGYIFSPSSQSVTINLANPASVNFTASAVSAGHSVDLSWIASTTSTVAGYNVYRSAISGGPYTMVSPAPVTSTIFSDLSVSAGSTYYYVVTAVDSAGVESSYSNQAGAVIPNP